MHHLLPLLAWLLATAKHVCTIATTACIVTGLQYSTRYWYVRGSELVFL